MGREWEESSEIINAVRENIRAADSRSAISRLKKWYQPTQEVVLADSRSGISRPSEHRLPTEKNRLIRYSE